MSNVMKCFITNLLHSLLSLFPSFHYPRCLMLPCPKIDLHRRWSFQLTKRVETGFAHQISSVTIMFRLIFKDMTNLLYGDLVRISDISL